VDEALATVTPTIRALSEAWNRADAEAFASQCTADVDFINLLGMYVKGRAAVVAIHEKIFNGPYAASTLEFTVESVRMLSDDFAVAIVPGTLRIPAGPVKGVVTTIATMVLVRTGSSWLVASFQNTRREATAANHIAVMIDAVGDDTER
jgi:uncharacterized protein (TIGR02246 family)